MDNEVVKMGSTFYSLNVGCGEAFLLRTMHARQEKVILVDSGSTKGAKDNHPLVDAILSVAPDIKKIDIAVCTHADQDHAGGYSNFVEYWCNTEERSIGEFWLPEEWSLSLPFIGCGNRIENCIVYGSSIEPNDLYLKDLADTMREELQGTKPKQIVDEECHNRDIMDEYENLLVQFAGNKGSKIIRNSIIKTVIQSAKLIVSVMASVITSGHKVRWFSFSEYTDSFRPSGGDTRLLEPVNSVEVLTGYYLGNFSVNRHCQFLFEKMCLTPINKHSLVFLRPANDEPSVLFCADSDLKYRSKSFLSIYTQKRGYPAKQDIVVTAPHHGSSSNNEAYADIANWLAPSGCRSYYIRNGGESVVTIEKYKKMEYTVCTKCVAGICVPQLAQKKIDSHVIFESKNGKWVWEPSGGASLFHRTGSIGHWRVNMIV